MNLNPSTQINLFEHKEIFNQLYKLYKNDNLPNKILLSGEKGIGKSTLAYHLINFVLSENEEHPYDYENNKINPDNKSYKLIQNKSNPNFYLIDVLEEKKNIDINQIRELITNLNKSSFNNKKRWIDLRNNHIDLFEKSKELEKRAMYKENGDRKFNIKPLITMRGKDSQT